jgi:hypothetical protein
MGQLGDYLTPYHMPQNALMNKEGVKIQDGIRYRCFVNDVQA